MANAIDDLRYISRYGYRDPWAEATNNITNSLLAYAKSKNDRDVLIAQVEQRREQENQRRIEAERDDVINMARILPSDEVGDFLRGQNMFGPAVDAVIQNSDKSKIKSDNRQSLVDTISNTKLPLDDRIEAANEGFLNATTSQDQVYFNRFKTNLNQEKLKVDTKNSYLEMGNSMQSFLGDDQEAYNNALEDDNIVLAKSILERAVTRTGNTLTGITSMYNNIIKNNRTITEKAAIGDLPIEMKNKSDGEMDEFERKYLSVIPAQYRTNNFSESLANWQLNTKAKDLGQPKPQGRGKEKPTVDDAKTQTIYKPIDGVSEGNIQLPNTAMVSLINPRTNTPFPQKFTSDVARRMVETGQGTINKNNAMIEFEWATRDDFTAAGSRAITYQSIEKPSRYSTAGMQNRNKRITLRSGDEVMDKSSGKRFPVVIDQPPRAVSRDDIGYIVNGNRYNFQQFINKFAKPMYDIEETEIMEKTNDISTGNFNVISIEAIQ